MPRQDDPQPPVGQVAVDLPDRMQGDPQPAHRCLAERLTVIALEAPAHPDRQRLAIRAGQWPALMAPVATAQEQAVVVGQLGWRLWLPAPAQVVGRGAQHALVVGQPARDQLGASRQRLLRAVDASLARLRTDYIDLLQLHAFDAGTPLEETLDALDGLVRAGKLRYYGVSNFSGWQLMKALAIADRRGLARPVAHQAYYSLVGRNYEWELMPLALDQGVGTVVWSPLGWGRLTGRIRRGEPLPERSRLHDTAAFAPPVDDERLYRVVDALDAVAARLDASVPEVALAWLLRRPTVSTVLLGARNEAQLRQNLGAAALDLSQEHITLHDTASHVTPPYPYYPYWNGMFTELAPPAVPVRNVV